MRAGLGWLVFVCGLCLAAAGMRDAAYAWWGQRSLDVVSSEDALALPPGFTAKLIVPRLNESLYVVNAAKPRDLRRGPGYIRGSSRPGRPGNSIIAGHRDLHFRFLKDIRAGDTIEVQSPSGNFIYRVASTQIVSSTDAAALKGVYPSQLTLVTCYPFFYVGPAPERFIVRAYPVKQL